MQAGFSAKDLALALPDKEVGDALSLRYIQDGTQNAAAGGEFKPNIDPQKKTFIYRAGKRPDFAEEEEEETWVQKLGNKHEDAAPISHNDEVVGDSRMERLRNRQSNRQAQEAEIIDEGDDSDEERERSRRRARAKARRAARDSDDDEQPQYVEGDIVPGDQIQEESEEEDDDAIAARRAAIREKLRARRQAEEEEDQDKDEMAIEEEGDEEKKEEAEDSDEWETDTDDESEEESKRPLFRPVFVSKAERDTVTERQAMEQKEIEAEEKRLLELEQRKLETRQMVADEIRRGDHEVSTANQDVDESNIAMPDDADVANEEDHDTEVEAWKLRELKRIKKAKEEREEYIEELAQTERRRNMTDEERRLDDIRIGKNAPKDKAEMKFMQKYYHKGAFYMDEDSIKDKGDVRLRVADGATLEDKFDRAALPKVMQVKKFGFAGRTKYTHLVDQDTTDRDSNWAQKGHARDKAESKMAGVHGDLDTAGRLRKRPKT